MPTSFPLHLAALFVGLLVAAPFVSAQDAASGAEQFRRCAACHAVGPGAENGIGPHLTGIIGRQIASVPRYRYSDGLSARGGEVWDADKVTTYIADPTRFIGERSRMPAQRLRPRQIADLIAYLASQGS